MITLYPTGGLLDILLCDTFAENRNDNFQYPYKTFYRGVFQRLN